MAHNIRIKGDQIEVALRQVLNSYSANVTGKINQATEAAAKKLVKITKQTAPNRTGKYRRAIDAKLLEKRAVGDVWIWYAKEPRHRLTHLLVHGHKIRGAKRKKERTKADPFLNKAIAEVEPEYIAAITKAAEEANAE